MKFAIALVGLALICGCAKTVNSVNISHEGSYDWIKTDSSLSDIASVVRVNKVREQDLLHVQVEVMNTGSSPQVFQYRYIWIDGNGFTLQSPTSAWQRKFIQGKQTVSIDGVAPDTRVADCRLEMKRTDK
ncbi:MAG TPA: YcfL family protein [Tepidisphaeraceae bacterium]|nr:YcfL family protein [Tepidisphaeraceae bacterium]